EGSHAEAEGQQVDRGFHDRGEGGGTPGMALEDPFAGHNTAHGVEFETDGTHVGLGAGVLPCLLQAHSTFSPVRATKTSSRLLSRRWGVPKRSRSESGISSARRTDTVVPVRRVVNPWWWRSCWSASAPSPSGKYSSTVAPAYLATRSVGMPRSTMRPADMRATSSERRSAASM